MFFCMKQGKYLLSVVEQLTEANTLLSEARLEVAELQSRLRCAREDALDQLRKTFVNALREKREQLARDIVVARDISPEEAHEIAAGVYKDE